MKDFRRLVNEDYRILANPEYSQASKREALVRLKNRKDTGVSPQSPDAGKPDLTPEGSDGAMTSHSQRTQRPPTAYRDPMQGFNIAISGTAPSVEEDMLNVPKTAYGHPVAAWQQFSNREVAPLPKTVRRTHNETNFGYSDAPSVGMMANSRMAESVHHISNSLHTSAQRQGKHIRNVFETYERTHNSSQEELYLVGVNLGILTEKFDSTAGQWVVTMPYSNPQSAEQVLYNQKGISNVDYKTLSKKQTGNYDMTMQGGIPGREPELPPAKKDMKGSNLEYHAKDTKAMQSLRNPKRGDDFIRRARLEEQKMVAKLQDMDARYEKGNLDKLQKKKLVKEMKSMLAKLRSAKAINDKKEKDMASERAQKQAMSNYAEQVSGFHHPDADLREQNTYNRHLSLLESAKRVLSDRRFR